MGPGSSGLNGPNSWPRYVSVMVHASSAPITIALFSSVYMRVFAERGAIDSVIHGGVSEDFLRRYHPGWYKEIVGSSTPRK